ncbi:DUF1376 domain-containing protein [Pseudomonas sp. VE 196-7]|uniref:DUF1376 domain-containing protein n=1 Tax=Pseudomonas sp. VE 196-7 TaxID=2956726 RepID=UPI0021D4AC49|nr:DUF1376 domain-containing protein [Pseudomonas sp. VE 196-7]MCU7218039.1 DUF1376 domain-containing protein [Pseudomonas sp. VE 196-7]
MAALPYIQLYVADYLADTAHLTAEEHGAYLLLIFNYWQTGKPIPKPRLHRIARISPEHWPEIESVLAEFFEDDGERWIHLRLERDIESVMTSPRGKKLPDGESISGFKGYVYFVTAPDSDLVKIGYSKNPWARLSELRRSHGVALSVVATIKTVDKSETTVHAALSEFREEGEWFRKSECVKALISAVSDGKVTTVAGIRSYADSYGSPATATTNTDTDTDTEETTHTTHASDSPPAVIEDHTTRPRFAITDEWEPDPKTFTAVLFRNGMAGQTFHADQLLEFRSYWISRPDDLKTQAQWEHALAQQLKRQARTQQAQGVTHETGGRTAQRRTRNAHDILTDPNW